MLVHISPRIAEVRNPSPAIARAQRTKRRKMSDGTARAGDHDGGLFGDAPLQLHRESTRHWTEGIGIQRAIEKVFRRPSDESPASRAGLDESPQCRRGNDAPVVTPAPPDRPRGISRVAAIGGRNKG